MAQSGNESNSNEALFSPPQDKKWSRLHFHINFIFYVINEKYDLMPTSTSFLTGADSYAKVTYLTADSANKDVYIELEFQNTRMTF